MLFILVKFFGQTARASDAQQRLRTCPCHQGHFDTYRIISICVITTKVAKESRSVDVHEEVTILSQIYFAKKLDAEASVVEFSKWSKKFDHFDKIVSD
jgi:hypothetical protein